VLRARPSFALGLRIVVGVIVIAALAPWIVPFDPMTADPAVYLLPPAAATCWAPTAPDGYLQPRALRAARRPHHRRDRHPVSAVIGGAIGAVVGYYEGQRRGDGRSAPS